MDEQQQEMPPWRWPERLPTGPASSRPSAPEPNEPASDPVQHQEAENGTKPAGESSGALALRSAVVTLVSSTVSTLAAFGLHLDETRSAALISFITAASAVASLLLSGRGRG